MQPQFNATIADASVELVWTSSTIISDLPIPGTKGFGVLLKALEPHKPIASEISVERRSSRISDTVIRFGFRNPDVRLSVLHTGFRLNAYPFENGYQDALSRLAICAQAHLEPSERPRPEDRFSVRYQSHLRLEDAAVPRFLRGLVGECSGTFEPDGCSFRFTPPDPDGVISARVFSEVSNRISGGLFVECMLELAVRTALDALTERAMEMVGYAIESLGIRLEPGR